MHLARPRRRPVRVPSLYLWSRLPRRQVEAPRRQVRLTLELLLQLLALAAVLAALARPVRAAVHPPSGRTAVILDASLSMAAQDRWPQALGQVRARLGGLAADEELTLILLDAHPRVLGRGYPADVQAMVAGLEQVRPAGSAGPLEEAWALARSGQPDRMVLVTDGGLEGPVPPGLEVVQLGRPVPNQALLDLDAAPLPNGGRQLYLRLANWSDGPARRSVRVLAGGEVLHRETVQVEAEGVFEASWRLPPDIRGIEVELEGRDAFPDDDRAWLDLTGAGGVALELAEGVPQAAGDLLQALAAGTGGAPVREPPVQVLTNLSPSPPPGGVLLLGRGSAAPAADLTAGPSPLLEGVSTSELEGLPTHLAPPPGWLKPVLHDSEGRVLLAVGERDQTRVAWLGLRLDQAVLQRASVLVLLDNVLRHLAPPEPPSSVVAGDPFVVEGRPWLDGLQIRGPSGPRAAAPGQPIRLDRPGVHLIEGLGSISVLPARGRETDLRLRLPDPVPEAAAEAAEPAGTAELAPWLALLAAGLLALEAWWSRRWTGGATPTLYRPGGAQGR